MQQLIFIINPISGDVNKANLPFKIQQHLDHSKYNYEIRFTERAGHAKFIAQEAVENQVDVVVAVGGDGSINEVAQALVHTPVKLGIIALGSGNGLASHLKLPIANVKKSIDIINESYCFKMDIGDSNLGFFVSCAGVGLDALVARSYRHHGKRGFLSYALAVAKHVLNPNSVQKISYEIEGKQYQEQLLLLSIFNSKYYGYKVSLLPEASVKDAFLDVVVLKQFAWWKTLYIFILAMVGKIHLAKEAKIYKLKNLKIIRKKKMTVQLDGDSFITSGDFEISIIPNSINVIIKHGKEED